MRPLRASLACTAPRAGASAAFTDPLMPDMYDTTNNWTTLPSNWDAPTWGAPEKQKQWWLGRRPAWEAMVPYYCTAAACANISQPMSVRFYYDSNINIPNGDDVPVSRYYPLNFVTTTVSPIPDAPRGMRDANAVDPLRCPGVTFIPAPSCPGMWIPANATWASQPASATAPLLSAGGWLGWRWVDEASVAFNGSSYDNTCTLFLEDLVPPQGSELRWIVEGAYACEWSLDVTSLGPNGIVGDPELLGGYQAKQASWQNVQLLAHTNASDSTDCDVNEGYDDADTCTLSVTPEPYELRCTTLDGSGRPVPNIPQGVPIITCQRADGSFITDKANHFTLRYMVAGYTRRTADPTPRGLLPRVACNRAASSPRFGGRCAAPVVQYLAYDEAYHTPDARAAGFPEYGGCLAGGIMRGLADSANYSGRASWFTPPLWPWEVWRSTSNGSALNADQTRLDQLYKNQAAFKLPAPDSPAGEGASVRQQQQGQRRSAASRSMRAFACE